MSTVIQMHSSASIDVRPSRRGFEIFKVLYSKQLSSLPITITTFIVSRRHPWQEIFWPGMSLADAFALCTALGGEHFFPSM